jgi:hypothetical protein
MIIIFFMIEYLKVITCLLLNCRRLSYVNRRRRCCFRRPTWWHLRLNYPMKVSCMTLKVLNSSGFLMMMKVRNKSFLSLSLNSSLQVMNSSAKGKRFLTGCFRCFSTMNCWWVRFSFQELWYTLSWWLRPPVLNSCGYRGCSGLNTPVWKEWSLRWVKYRFWAFRISFQAAHVVPAKL